MTQHFEIDHDWIREQQANGDGSSVTVRLTVTGTMAREGVLEWLQDLGADPLGSRGRGDWLVREVKSSTDYAIVDITAGGDDVAAALEDATGEAHDVLNELGATLEWQPLDQDDPKP